MIPLVGELSTVAPVSFQVSLVSVPQKTGLGVFTALKQITSVIVSVILPGQAKYNAGFTVTVAVTGVPVQVIPALVYDGVMVKVTVTGAAVVLVSEPLMLPLPLAAIPVTVRLSLVQLYTVPAILPLFTMVVIAEPEQMVCDDGVATASGIGFTVTVAVIAVPVQVTSPLV